MKRFLFLLLLAPGFLFAADEKKPHPFSGKLERYDPAFDQLIAPNTVLEKLAEGFTWSEGPVWFDGGVIFSDVPENTAYRWKPGATKAIVFLKPSGQLTPAPGFREAGSNGIARDLQGRLVLCQCGERRLARYEDGKFTSIVDRYEGKRLNSPNDVVVRKSGEIYFTDPPYGLEKMNDSPLKELPFNGVFRVATDGKVTLLAKNLTFPNGIAFSPDEKTLYVSVSDPNSTRIVAYEVKTDGTLGKDRTFFDAQPLHLKGVSGLCDGMKVDREGNVFCAGPGGVLVISSTGKLLGLINTGEPTGNCCWGDDGSALYITANTYLLRVRTQTKGAGW